MRQQTHLLSQSHLLRYTALDPPTYHNARCAETKKDALQLSQCGLDEISSILTEVCAHYEVPVAVVSLHRRDGLDVLGQRGLSENEVETLRGSNALLFRHFVQ